MSRVVVTVCRACPAGQAGWTDRLKGAFAADGIDVDVRETACMSGCTRPSTLSFRAIGKTAYLFGDLTEADVPNLLTFLRLYLESYDGNLADARPLGSLREKAIARIPA